MFKISPKSYWPVNPGNELNETVAYLFCQIRNKITCNLTNKSKFILALDLLVPKTRKELLKIVVQEFENLILDILELDLSIADIHILKFKMLYDLLYKSSHRFLLNNLSINSYPHMIINEEDLYIKIILQEDILILENLIICLIFGSFKTPYSFFNPKSYNISYLHIEVFLQNLVIRIGDTVTYLIFNTKFVPDTVYTTLCQSNIYHQQYLSTRTIEEFKNNLLYQNLLYFYLEQPKAIYSNQYQVRIFSPYGIVGKIIHINRTNELKYLSYIQLFITGFLEFQDFFIPKIKYIIFIMGKIIIYISFSFLDNIIQFLFRIIIRNLKK